MSNIVQDMFTAGAHYGYGKTRRHPSVKPYIFFTKNRYEVIDLEKTLPLYEKALEYAKELKKAGKKVLFVGTKPEARAMMRDAAQSLGMPYVDNRWVGGTLTNFKEINKRVKRLEDLLERTEKGTLVYQTKKEKLLLEREMNKLNRNFGGLRDLKDLPDALFVIDSLKESIAVDEANRLDIPVIALCNTDCNIEDVQYPMLGNDASTSSIQLYVTAVTEALKK